MSVAGPTGTFTWWDWPVVDGGLRAVSWTLTPLSDPTPDGYFWSHQVWLAGGPAAYAGLQTVGSAPTGKIAIFSVWDAVAADGPEFAAPFTGEGDGYSVRVRFDWIGGGTYRLRVAAAGTGAGAWSAWVDDRWIGAIQVGEPWARSGLGSTSVMWTERYAGSLRRLADIRRAEARFGTPVGEDAGGREVAPTGHRNTLADPPGSPGSSVADADAAAGGVVQVMGLA